MHVWGDGFQASQLSVDLKLWQKKMSENTYGTSNQRQVPIRCWNRPNKTIQIHIKFTFQTSNNSFTMVQIYI